MSFNTMLKEKAKQNIINLQNVLFKKFPGGELHITDDWIQDRTSCPIKVIARIQSSDDLMKLMLFTNACKCTYGMIPDELVLPYIPYARQDRVANIGEALSIKVFSDILNSLNYSKVIVLDPHSDVSSALINNIVIIPQWKIWGDYLNKQQEEGAISNFDLISPDAGALKKIYKLAEATMCKHIRVGTKHRDTITGKITGTSVDGQAKNKLAIIVDDICDGGRTFIEVAKVIKEQYDELMLCVTHGIFSNGLSVLNEYYDIITCTNSFIQGEFTQDSVHIIPLETIL